MPRKPPKKVDQFSNISRRIPVQFRSQVPKLSQCGRLSEERTEAIDRLNLGSPREEKWPLKTISGDDIKPPEIESDISFETFQSLLGKLSGQIRDVFELQLVWSLRAVEALSIKNEDILPNGLVFIPGRKGSNDRFVFCPSILKYHISDVWFSKQKIFYVSYTAYYNSLKKHGICFARSDRYKLNIVTHSARKYNIQAIKDLTGVDIHALMSYTGHKSLSGINYYLGINSITKKGGKNNG